MGQHKTNPNVVAVKRGELKPKPKAVKPLTKREESFLARWTAVIMGNRPTPHTDGHRCARSISRWKKRVTAARLRQVNRLAVAIIRERKKAARRIA